MILVLNLKSREQDELMQALYDHRRALGSFNIAGRYKQTDSVIEKINHARTETENRP